MKFEETVNEESMVTGSAEVSFASASSDAQIHSRFALIRERDVGAPGNW